MLKDTFASINILYLLSLGFISWIIICYIKQIEFMEKSNSKNEFHFLDNTEPEIRTFGKVQDILRGSTVYSNNYDFCINFLWLSVCVYVVIKLVLKLEFYIIKYVRTKYYLDHNEGTNNKEVIDKDTLLELHQKQEYLLKRVHFLEQQNNHLEKIICEAENRKLNLKKNEEISKSEVFSGLQNIFISNRHFHVNRQVFVKERDQTLSSNENEDTSPKKSDSVNQVWDKYLHLQQAESNNAGNEVASVGPVVISSEELQNLFQT